MAASNGNVHEKSWKKALPYLELALPGVRLELSISQLHLSLFADQEILLTPLGLLGPFTAAVCRDSTSLGKNRGSPGVSTGDNSSLRPSSQYLLPGSRELHENHSWDKKSYVFQTLWTQNRSSVSIEDQIEKSQPSIFISKRYYDFTTINTNKRRMRVGARHMMHFIFLFAFWCLCACCSCRSPSSTLMLAFSIFTSILSTISPCSDTMVANSLKMVFRSWMDCTMLVISCSRFLSNLLILTGLYCIQRLPNTKQTFIASTFV